MPDERVVGRIHSTAARGGVPGVVRNARDAGAGKTTALNLLGGLTRPSRGKVWIAGREISELPDRELAKVRLSRIGLG